LAAGLRAVDERVLVAVDVLAREAVEFFAVLRLAVDRLTAGLRAPLLRADDEAEAEPLLVVALPSIVHLPVITRCAASATASAISEPSLVALAIMLLAACDAVSAASRPASRIARRAFGLALIAAAAAASPAASISLLIAPLASLSTVLSLEPEEDREVLEDVLRADFAITCLPPFATKTLHGCNGSLTTREVLRFRMNSHVGTGIIFADMLKGTAASRSDALRHGQRPEMWPFVSF